MQKRNYETNEIYETTKKSKSFRLFRYFRLFRSFSSDLAKNTPRLNVAPPKVKKTEIFTLMPFCLPLRPHENTRPCIGVAQA
jgi:hypothetical protein